MNNNKSDEGISGSGSNQASVANNGNRVLKLGLDVHYRQVTVAMQEDGGRIKAAGKMRHADFLNWVHKKLEENWEIYSCYEAGASEPLPREELRRMAEAVQRFQCAERGYRYFPKNS